MDIEGVNVERVDGGVFCRGSSTYRLWVGSPCDFHEASGLSDEVVRQRGVDAMVASLQAVKVRRVTVRERTVEVKKVEMAEDTEGA